MLLSHNRIISQRPLVYSFRCRSHYRLPLDCWKINLVTLYHIEVSFLDLTWTGWWAMKLWRRWLLSPDTNRSSWTVSSLLHGPRLPAVSEFKWRSLSITYFLLTNKCSLPGVVQGYETCFYSAGTTPGDWIYELNGIDEFQLDQIDCLMQSMTLLLTWNTKDINQTSLYKALTQKFKTTTFYSTWY